MTKAKQKTPDDPKLLALYESKRHRFAAIYAQNLAIDDKLNALLIELRDAEVELHDTPMPKPRTKALRDFFAGPCQRRNDLREELREALLNTVGRSIDD